jgi:hypothetical protein
MILGAPNSLDHQAGRHAHQAEQDQSQPDLDPDYGDHMRDFGHETTALI